MSILTIEIPLTQAQKRKFMSNVSEFFRNIKQECDCRKGWVSGNTLKLKVVVDGVPHRAYPELKRRIVRAAKEALN